MHPTTHPAGPPAGPPAPAGLQAPVHIAGPEGPWEELADRLEDTGRALLCTTWGQWLTAVLLDPALRPLLAGDWPRYRQTPAAAARMRFAVSRVVLKYTAATALDVPPHTLDLAHRPGGRPVLRGAEAGARIELGVAHTGELIAVGVSRTGPIGVHAEPAARDLPYATLRDQLCTPREAAALDALPTGERRTRLLSLWTLREAHAQALGHGARHRMPAPALGHDTLGRPFLHTPTRPDTRPDTGHDPDPRPDNGPGAGPGAGRPSGPWEVAAHLVHDRYLLAAAHRPHPAPAGPAGAGAPAPARALDTASRSTAGPLKETAPRPGGELRFLRPVTSGRGEGRRTP